MRGLTFKQKNNFYIFMLKKLLNIHRALYISIFL